MNRLIATILLAPALLLGVAGDDEARIEGLKARLITPCCWKEPVTHHRSEAALQMKLEIQQMVASGKTDRDILDHYVAQYGPRILVEPEGGVSFWMHVVPMLAIILGLLAAIQVLRKWRQPVDEAS